MSPVLKRGRSVWDQSFFPLDEYRERVAAVRSALSEAHMAGAIVFGHAGDYGGLSYLTGLVPMLGWAATVLPTDGDPVLISMSGSRELAFLRTLSWVSEIKTTGLFAAPGTDIRTVLESCGLLRSPVGISGAQSSLTTEMYGTTMQALADCDLRDCDSVIRGILARKRPREVSAIRKALSICHLAAAAAEQAFLSGASNAAALVAAERAARVSGAHDFRGLANVDGDQLSPFQNVSEDHRSPFVLYVAVEWSGYWAELAATVPRASDSAPAARALSAMLSTVRAGVSGAEVAKAGLAALPGDQVKVALEYGLGSAIGLGLNEHPRISPNSQQSLHSGDVVSLMVFPGDWQAGSVASAMAVVGDSGSVPLDPL